MPNDEIQAKAKKPWNPLGAVKVPLHRWMNKSATPEDDERLKCVGNAVIPQCGRLAIH